MASLTSETTFSSEPTVTIVITIGSERAAVVSLSTGWIVRPDGLDRFVIERYDSALHEGRVGIPVPQQLGVEDDMLLFV